MENSTPSKRGGAGTFFGLLVVLALIALVVVLDVRRRDAEKKLTDLSLRYEQMQAGNQAQNREAAKRVVERVKRLYRMPAGIDPTVATIVDVDELRKRNSFYAKAKNGDNVILTQDRAILYDPVADIIVDMVPVQVQPAAAPAQGAGASVASSSSSVVSSASSARSGR